MRPSQTPNVQSPNPSGWQSSWVKMLIIMLWLMDLSKKGNENCNRIRKELIMSVIKFCDGKRPAGPSSGTLEIKNVRIFSSKVGLAHSYSISVCSRLIPFQPQKL
ncbi:hypothetical protein V6Z12_D02G141300 [Gossypium hirsutum]